MAMDLLLKALNKAADQVNLRVTKKGDLFTAKRLPDLAVAVMSGKIWAAQDTTTTAGVATFPGVTSGLTMQNPASSGKWYVVFGVSFLVDVMPATEESFALYHCAHKLAIAALTRDITLQATGAGSINGYKAGQGAYPGVVILDRGATVVDDGWSPISLTRAWEAASNVPTAGLVPLLAPVIVPPSFHYSVAATTSVVTTVEIGLGLVWGEFDEDELE